MVSLDPVAVDSATLDFCERSQLLPDEQIQQIRGQIHAALSVGVGTMKYQLETVAY